jgi:hypothetical protein
MTDLHPPPEPGWSRSLWPRDLRTRIALDARLHTWRALGVLLLSGIALIACGGAAIYDAIAGEPHRYTLDRNPVTEWIIGPAAIAMFGASCAYVVAVMLTKLRLASRSEAEPNLDRIEHLLPKRGEKSGSPR